MYLVIALTRVRLLSIQAACEPCSGSRPSKLDCHIPPCLSDPSVDKM